MISLNAKAREQFGVGMIKAVVYGPNAKNASIAVDEKEFKKVFKQAGESSLVELLIDKDKRPVLIHEIQKDPVSGHVIHIDFYQADLSKEVQVTVPLVFEGLALAEKDLGGTLNKNMLEIEVRGLPQNLPHEIVVNVEGLKTFEDHILVKDLKLPANVKPTKNPDEVVCAVLAPVKIEEELAKEITEDVESVEKVEKPAKEGEEEIPAEEVPKEAKPKEEPKK